MMESGLGGPLCVGGLAQEGFTEETGKTSPLWMERSGLAGREESLAMAWWSKGMKTLKDQCVADTWYEYS